MVPLDYVLAVAVLTTATPLAQQPRETFGVRGHWVLQVRDRGGAVVTRREFDNDLSAVAVLIFNGVFGRQASLGRYGVELATGGNDANGVPYVNPFGAARDGSSLARHFIEEPTVAASMENANNEFPFSGIRLQITGATASTAGYITGVGTQARTCSETTTTAVCRTGQNNGQRYSFTSTNIPPLRLDPGQMLDVTVVISFGSLPHPPTPPGQ